MTRFGVYLHPDASRPLQIELSGLPHRRVRIGSGFHGARHQLAPSSITFGLRARVHDGAPGKVYIRADGRARYSAVASVLDGIHSAGLTHIAFLTEQSR